ncbi:MAG: protocatechuate 3,4-dioxygenase [Acidobacteria bacterium]|nr:protocatechuate 3,4-dioxygenase [Acidobacteriota bacterium]
MNNQRKVFSRREMLEMTLGIGGLAMLGGSAFAQETQRLITPVFDAGPFYPVQHSKDIDADLTFVNGHKRSAQGDILYVEGRVLNQSGEAVSGAKIEIWQANKFGRYAHPSDTNTAPLDENFQGFAVLKTDSQGRYRFKTIKPGAYPNSPTTQRTPHIHFDVMGKSNRLVTQMFFPDEPLNEKDILFLELRSRFEVLKRPPGSADVLIAKSLPPTKEVAANAMSLSWDIVLRNG